MNKSSKISLGIVGFPGLYGGAGVELDNQITLWYKMGWDLHIVPTQPSHGEPLLFDTNKRAKIYEPGDYKKLKDMPVISFCNDVFLSDISKIKKYAAKTIFVNCMSWLFEAEKDAHKKGLIDLFLYQTKHTRDKVSGDLIHINKNYKSQLFRSYFDKSKFPFHTKRLNDRFRFGRISREDADKYAKDTLWIYETMVAPGPKDGIILGFDDRSKGKIGQPPEWIRTYIGNGITQQEFYAHCACIIQKCDTYENWPRVGMEAMASGSVLIVDNRGGWCEMVKHGQTGWLCNEAKDFVYYASRMAYEPQEREILALNARQYLDELTGEAESMKSWNEVLCA